MIIDGKAIAQNICDEIKRSVKTLTGRAPCLTVILVGDNPASRIYVNRKVQACETAGMKSIKKEFPLAISSQELVQEIEKLNRDPQVDGILVQLPLPEQIEPALIMTAIEPEKDVDGFHPINVGKLLIGDPEGFIPCTPLGIQVLLEEIGVDPRGKQVLILGRSNIVGKPMAALFMRSGKGGDATVTIAHRFSKNIQALGLSADIIVAAMGKPHFITKEMVKEGAVVIDVGINKIADPSSKSGVRIVGDVDFENVQHKCAYITPVPGGVGPMTIAMLLRNTLKSYCRKERLPLP